MEIGAINQGEIKNLQNGKENKDMLDYSGYFQEVMALLMSNISKGHEIIPPPQSVGRFNYIDNDNLKALSQGKNGAVISIDDQLLKNIVDIKKDASSFKTTKPGSVQGNLDEIIKKLLDDEKLSLTKPLNPDIKNVSLDFKNTPIDIKIQETDIISKEIKSPIEFNEIGEVKKDSGLNSEKLELNFNVKNKNTPKNEGENFSINLDNLNKELKESSKNNNIAEENPNYIKKQDFGEINTKGYIPKDNKEAPAIITRNEDILDVAVNKFKSLRLPEFTEVRVKLKPEDLGEITVRVVLEKGQINGNITADKKEVAAILQNNIETLKQDLKNSNVNLTNISVNVESDGNFNNFQSRHFQQNENNHRKEFLNVMDEAVNDSIEQDGFNIFA